LGDKPEEFSGLGVDGPALLVKVCTLLSCMHTVSILYDDKFEGKPSFREASASYARFTAECQASSNTVFGRFEVSSRWGLVSRHLKVNELKRRVSWPGHLKGRICDGEGASSRMFLGAACEISP
jgi:hypothetical protein